MTMRGSNLKITARGPSPAGPARQTALGHPEFRLITSKPRNQFWGTCLLSLGAIAKVLEITNPEHFYKPFHTEMFKASHSLSELACSAPEEAESAGRLISSNGNLGPKAGRFCASVLRLLSLAAPRRL